MLTISIIIPTYNRRDQLEKCLKSILISDDNDIEVIISDNASTDNTIEFLNKIQDKRVLVLQNEKNIGADRNLKKLVLSAHGEYVFIITDDSFLSETSITDLKKIITEHPGVGVIISCLAYVSINSGKIVGYRSNHLTPAYYKPGNEGLIEYALELRSWPRLVVKRSLIVERDLELHIDCIYQSMYWIGKMIKEAGVFYTNKVLVTAFGDNINYWKYPSDFGLSGSLKIIDDLFLLESELKDKRALQKKLFKEDTDGVLSIGKINALKTLIGLNEIKYNRYFLPQFIIWIPKFVFRKLKRVLFNIGSKRISRSEENIK
jgi:glycosyltransferase involved in cell wall biosynthesis